MKKILLSLLEIFETVVIAVVAVFLVRTYVAQPFLVSGSSMEPNFYDKDYLLVDELTFRFREPERGEVIVFKYPGDLKSYYIKRVIGLPGEQVIFDHGKVTVYHNGEKLALDENYIRQVLPSTGYDDITLGKNQYFVMGDNRNFSFDSRSWGPVSQSEIVGLARFRLWPIDKVMAFSRPIYNYAN